MKYQTLLIIAASLKVLAWVVGIIGAISSIFLGVAASVPIPKIYILLSGFMVTAVGTVLLLATSKFIYLFIDIEANLSEIAGRVKAKPTD